jgi:pimeloyl-ACP methyl ester carboxylesterase
MPFGAAMLRGAVAAGARRFVPMPAVGVPVEGRTLELPGRGRTFVIDVPGPTPDAPTIVLLHALVCSAYLGWSAAITELAQRYRVVTFDQRWHGRGIRSSRFRLDDCADDVVAVLDALDIDDAVVAGYSMGGAVAQLAWCRHRDRVRGLVLCSTARNFRGKTTERMFFATMVGVMWPLSRYALGRVERLAGALPLVPSIEVGDARVWTKAQFRSTSAWAVPEVLTEMGRFNSAGWISDVDVPCAVVVTAADRAIPTRRQHRLAESIPEARVFEVSGGHVAQVMDSGWLPVFLEAADQVLAEAYGVTQLAASTG